MHSTGSPIGTGSMILLATFSLRPCFTSSFQCIGIGVGHVVCKVYIQFWWVWADLVDIYGKGIDLLKALSLNWFEMYISNSGTFSLVEKLVNFYGCGGGVWYGDTVVVLSVDMEYIFVPLVACMGYGMIFEGFWYQ